MSHPTSHPTFIFAYGSLINTYSLHRTLPLKKRQYIPVTVQGLKRSFNFRCKERALYTALGVTFCCRGHGRHHEIDSGIDTDDDESDSEECYNCTKDVEDEETITTRLAPVCCNGMLIEVFGDEELELLDTREKGYKRVSLNNKLIRPWREDCGCGNTNNGSNSKIWGRVWTYAVEEPENPNPCYPIAQTYVDVCLAGCLDVGLQFAVQFLQTTSFPIHSSHQLHTNDIYHDILKLTSGGSSFVNDRLYARPRPDRPAFDIQLIDTLLTQYTPALSHRVEGRIVIKEEMNGNSAAKEAADAMQICRSADMLSSTQVAAQ